MSGQSLDRYRLGREIGRGSSGRVYEAEHLDTGRRVALKLGAERPADALHLKHEFRALARLSHPNLVQLFDLFVEADACFFTMERVEGVDLVRWVRPDGEADCDRLRDCLRQLAEGLGALHARRLFHRDLKPSNILVERGGRVVLLDFGFVTRLGSRLSLASRESALVGTPAYMAPELLMSSEVGRATDWYAVGVTLYEALTGQNPFDAPDLSSLIQRKSALPVPPQSLVPGVPAELDALTMALLDPDAARRPTGGDVLEMLARSGAARRHTRTPPRPETPSFIGRERELDALVRAYERGRSGGAVVEIEGASGIGKTTLVERFLDAREDDALVLHSHCHPHESVPFKAVDGIVDALTRYLAYRPTPIVTAVLPRNVTALAHVFPVLARISEVEQNARRPAGRAAPHELRRQAFAAFRELMARLSERRPLVLWIDDLQWGDLDSVSLLRELMRPPDAPRLLLVLSYRSEDRHRSPVLRSLAERWPHDEPPSERCRLRLAPLSDEESRRLARQLLANGTEGSAEDAVAVAREAEGNPFFVSELARHVAARRSAAASGASGETRAVRLADVLAERIARLTPLARHLLTLVSVAGRPVSERLLLSATEVRGDVLQALAQVRNHRLLRVIPSEEATTLTPYHDRIREALVAGLEEAERRRMHRRLAAALEALPDPDPQALLEHTLQAGERAAAAEHAYSAAEKASGALAFHQAATLYRMSLELGATRCPTWQLHAKLGEALVNAGAGAEGAGHFVQAADALAAEEPAEIEVRRLRRRAAEQYMRNGRHDVGMGVLREVLADAGVPYAPSPFAALLALALNRTRLRVARRLRRRSAEERHANMDPVQQERLEACWSAGVSMSVFDSVRAADYQVRHGLLAHRAGDDGHLANALATEALVLSWEGGGRKRRLAATLRRRGRELAASSEDPQVRATALVMAAVSAFFERRLDETLLLSEEGERVCREECRGAHWELANLQVVRANALAWLGELARLRTEIPALLREAAERSDHYATVMGRLGMTNAAWLAADDVEEARRQADAALRAPFPPTFSWPVYQGAFALAQIELYAGRAEAAREELRRAWSSLRAAHLFRFQAVRVEMRDLRARCAVRRAAETDCPPRERRRALAAAARDIRRLAREDAFWARCLARLLRTQWLALQGRREEAIGPLEAAARDLRRLDLRLHAAAARHSLGLLLEGAHGERLRGDAVAWAREHGVEDPPRMFALLAPATPSPWPS